jgi:glucoamylase
MNELERISNLNQQTHLLYLARQLAQEAQAHAVRFPDLFGDAQLRTPSQAIEEHLQAAIAKLKQMGGYATWQSPKKLGVGTAQTYGSKSKVNPSRVWFTLAEGSVSEVLYPTVDEVATKSLSFIVSDGASFVHHVPEDCISTVHLLDKRALTYEIVSQDHDGRYRLIQEIVTDPKRNTLLVNARLNALRGDASAYRLYLYWQPYLGEYAWLRQLGRVDAREFAALAWNEYHLAILRTEPRWTSCTIGCPDIDDGLISLRQKYSIGDSDDAPRRGRLAFTCALPQADTISVALGFRKSSEKKQDPAAASLADGFDAVKRAYVMGWNNYCRQLDNLQGQATDFYYTSAMVVKTHTDKTNLGAALASLCMPWGSARFDAADVHGYRQVWARDLYHAAMSLLAVGDRAAAAHVLDFIGEKLQRPDGGFPQTASTNGTPIWTGLQLDQVADPILLAWWLGAVDKYATMVKPAAEFLLKHGPATPFERWEENNGYSPATLAAEIAALVCAADLAERARDSKGAKKYRAVADEWQAKVDSWCFTTNGPWQKDGYYLRISPSGNPNVAEPIRLANGGGWFDQRAIVDPSFLELVRLGVKRADDARVRASLAVVDAVVKRETAKGPCWYRFNHDGYGETETERSAPGRAHVWPLLTGERGVFQVAAGNLESARELLAVLERMANQGGMLSEQVWEDSGEPTGSATPLAWAHAEYIILLKSIVSKQVVDRPKVVWERYAVHPSCE